MNETVTSPLHTPVRRLLAAGSCSELGVTRTAAGTNVAVHAPAATSMHLCLLRQDGREHRIALPGRTEGVWHGLLEPLAPGTRYGLRADGPQVPTLGLRFDAHRLLLDPYARTVVRHGPDWYGVVTDPADDESYDWGGDAHPRHPWERTVVYEAHVKGLSMRHPGVPESLRGTYAGLAHPALVEELARLGVTAVELLPVHQFASEPGLAARGLGNYWGYNTLGFFAPHDAYAAATGMQVREFKDMVRALHAAGIEVLLDVVYNHTAEGGPDLPALSLRGLDDAAYYLQLADGSGYLDVTGCGNTVQASDPVTARLILDSLRYWVTQMHVDGFRFDLASVLAREGARVRPEAGLLQAIAQDPVLAGTKLVAEPWDATPEGYLVGRFPPGWSEWNDRFRDTVRDFWRGKAYGVRELAYRLSGSEDLYGERRPCASVNFVTSHDGFTLRDSVSYERKHNEANGEGNRDGHGDNRTWNCGVEGATDDEPVLRLRHRQAANLLGTVLLSTGVPMLTAGDERGRTQHGNNNAYCQDNEVSWLDWSRDEQWTHLYDLTRQLTALRARHPALRPKDFPRGHHVRDTGVMDLAWFHPNGHQMAPPDWDDPSVQGVGMYLSGLETGGASFLLLFDAGPQVGPWTLPGAPWAAGYDVVVDTSATLSGRLQAGAPVDVADRCLMVLQVVDAAQSDATRSDAATARTTSV